MIADFLVWDRNDSQVVLVVQMDGWAPANPDGGDRGLQSFARRELLGCLAKYSCRHALIVHADETFLLSLVSSNGDGDVLEATARAPTAALFGAARPAANGDKGELLDHRVKAWLDLLVGPVPVPWPGAGPAGNGHFADLVRAAGGGHVVWEMVAECKRRSAAKGPRYSSQEIQDLLRALEAEWERTGGFDEEYMHAFLDRLRARATQ